MSAKKPTSRKAKPSSTAPATIATTLNSPLSVLMHRLEVASSKLDLVVAHYPDPGECSDGDIGAIALTRDVATELDVLYADFSDHLMNAGLTERGPWVNRFPENLPGAENDADTESQS